MKTKINIIGKYAAGALLLIGAYGVTSVKNTDKTAPSQSSDGPEACWAFDAATPAGLNSASGQFNAKIPKTVKLVAGLSGKALSLNDRDSAKVEIDAALLRPGLEALTFSAWIAPKPTNHSATIVGKDDNGLYGDGRLKLYVKDNCRKLSLGLNCGGNYAECDGITSPDELCDGRWHLATGTFDGSTMRVYLDGREIGSLERYAPLNTRYDYMPLSKDYWGPIVSGRYETIGELEIIDYPFCIGSARGKWDFFNGKIDEVRFYTHALSAKQVADLYAQGRQTPSQVVRQASANARKYYQKGNSFIESLINSDRQLASQKHELSRLEAVELQRLLREDFPGECSAYLVKWGKSPTDNLMLNEAARRARIEELAIPTFEYMPLTDLQWSVMPKSERTKWEHLRDIQHQFDTKADTYKAVMKADLLASLMYEMEDAVEARPARGETVAPYRKPETPATVNRTAAEAREVIERDWLFQCDNKPTVARSLKEIEWARQLAARLDIDATKQLAELNKLEAQARAKSTEAEDKALYFEVRTVKRDIMFSNPLIDFDAVVYIDNPYPEGSESFHETKHRLGYSGVPGGRLIVQKGLGPDGKMTRIMPQEPLHGTFWRPDLSYDAKRLLFAFKPHNEKTFHIYEIGIDGTGLRQLTGGIFDDFDPIYMPDGKHIMFLTTRGHIYVRCMPPTNAYVAARMPLDTKPGDKSLYILSRSGEPEYTPSVMNDGRVIYTRWEYTDKPLWRAQSLWTMRQNGTMVQTFWGNQSVWPDLLKDARQIPGSERVMFTGSAHHNWFSGSVGIIDPRGGFNFPHGLTKVTQDVEWPECGNGPVDPKENNTYHVSGKYDAYYSPYPLSEKDFLVSARRDGKYLLMLMDADGNREIINEGAHNIWDAMPVRRREKPIINSDNVAWPTWAERDNPQPGVMYSNNVYDGAPQELRNKAKYLRIWSIDHKTYTYWYKRPYVSSGPEISAVQSEGIKKIIGTVPIDDDGSVNFQAPSGIALHFQLLDENHRALQTMKSFTGVQPGETRGCLGCHESHSSTQRVASMGKALQSKPVAITAVPWDDISVSYERYVQPALDRYCAKCHAQPDSKATRRFNSALRPGFLGFKEPYMTLLGHPTWANAYRIPKETTGGFGWADIYMVEAFGTVDSVAYQTPKPMTRMSYKSRLVDCMASGKHHGVRVDPDNLLRVVLWVDAMGPYYGSEEILKMEDPRFAGRGWLSQPPRIQTAPVVPRPGPFDPFETDEAYKTPTLDCRNKLPAGVVRERESVGMRTK